MIDEKFDPGVNIREQSLEPCRRMVSVHTIVYIYWLILRYSWAIPSPIFSRILTSVYIIRRKEWRPHYHTQKTISWIKERPPGPLVMKPVVQVLRCVSYLKSNQCWWRLFLAKCRLHWSHRGLTELSFGHEFRGGGIFKEVQHAFPSWFLSCVWL